MSDRPEEKKVADPEKVRILQELAETIRQHMDTRAKILNFLGLLNNRTNDAFDQLEEPREFYRNQGRKRVLVDLIDFFKKI
jgi:hypothetical protein